MAEKLDDEPSGPEGDLPEPGEAAFSGSHSPTPLGDEESISIGGEVHDGTDNSDSSSTISIGTGRSTPDMNDWSPGDTGANDDKVGSHKLAFETDDGEPASAGSFELPDDFNSTLDADFAFGEASDPEARDKPFDADIVSEFSEFAEIENPEMAADLIGETSQDDLPAVWADGEGSADREESGLFRDDQLPGASGQFHRKVSRDGLPRRPPRRTHARGSIVGVIFGGLLAVPVVAVILLWGFRRDDFGIAAQIPESLSFLIPAELRQSTKKNLGADDALLMPRLPADGFGAENQLAASNPNQLVNPSGVGVTDRAPQEDAILNAADLVVLEMATVRADIMFESVRELKADAPETMRKAVLIDWYKSLAAVGEEAAAAERLMVTGGRSAAGVTQPLEKLLRPVMDSPDTLDQLEDLARQWVQASKRDSEGVIFPGILEGVRQAGSASVAVLRSGELEDRFLRMTVLSRLRPEAEEGERVVAVGVMVAENVMWAAAWISFKPSAGLEVTDPVGAFDP